MPEQPLDMPLAVWERLQERFPGALSPAEPPERGDDEGRPQASEHRITRAVSRSLLMHRPRYEGVLVHARHLLPVLRFLRDDLGYDYLSNLTAVDYPESVEQFAPHIDVVYHVFNLAGGGYVALHVHTTRDGAILPSITPEFPAANLQEREVWDMFGVQFEGHPDLRRLLMWEGFDGFPLRKDWREAYYEEEHKPYRSRFPDGGSPIYAEARTPCHANVRNCSELPEISEQGGEFSEADQLLYERMLSADRDPDKPLKTEEMILNMGPHHPSTHGVFRMAVRLDGETVRHLEPVFGYLHRNHEKIGERNTWLQNIPYTDRLDYINGMTNNLAYCVAMERLLGWEVPERAEYVRVIMSEFSRVVNHMLAAGFFSNEIGVYFTGSLYALEERELILDLFEEVSGARMMFNYMRPGGVAKDLPEGWVDRARYLVRERLPKKIGEMERFLLDNEIIQARSVGIGAMTAAEAIRYGVAGPVLRACGVPYDVRRAEPYGIYDRFEFDVVTRQGGDVFSRIALRFDEIWQSLRILEQALDGLPDGPIQSNRLSPRMRIPPGETYGRIEAPKGELGFYLVSDGGANPYRYHIRATSLLNLTPLSALTREVKIADVVAILGSIDLTMGEVDR
ncbi:MAG: NADH-quinone oxidoreductase subunit D [Anaerolineae bacterium]|nr:NADH-quinone oxidoreductase subunit D [Anaerolineae bacterium]